MGRLFIPVPAENSGIVITAICEGTGDVNIMGDATRFAEVLVEGVKYNRMTARPGVTENEIVEYSVDYTYGGQSYRETVTAKSLSGYFEQVLGGNPDNVTKTLIVHAANYCKAVINYTGVTTTDYDAIVSNYSSYITTVDDATVLADRVMSISKELTSYITGIAFVIGDGYLPNYAFMPANSSVTEITWSYTSHDGNTYTNNVTKGEHWSAININIIPHEKKG